MAAVLQQERAILSDTMITKGAVRRPSIRILVDLSLPPITEF